MHKLVKQQVTWIWIVLLGVLFSALAPTISHAMAAAAVQATEEVQVCTMEGMITIVVDKAQSGKPAAPTPDHVFKHCPYCVVHGGSVSLPPAPAFVFPVSPPATVYPPLFYRSAAPLFAWTAANPRGPPAA